MIATRARRLDATAAGSGVGAVTIAPLKLLDRRYGPDDTTLDPRRRGAFGLATSDQGSSEAEDSNHCVGAGVELRCVARLRGQVPSGRDLVKHHFLSVSEACMDAALQVLDVVTIKL